MATTIGTAYVQILPTTEGIAGNLTSALTAPAASAGSEAGKESGSSFVSSMASGIATGAAAVTGAVAAIGGAIVGVANQTAEYGDTIDKTSQKLGVSSTFYQEWDAVLQHSGTSMDSMTSSFKTLANASQDASADQQAAFEKLGLSMEQVQSMSTEDLFSAVISGLQDMGEGTERTALATDLLGKGAMEMGALLNTSSEDTQAMIDRVHELGGVMSEEGVKNCAAYEDSLQDMKTAFSGVKNGIIADVIPSLTTLMDGVSEFIATADLSPVTDAVGNLTRSFADFVSNLDIEAIGQVVQTVFTGIGEAISLVWDVASQVFSSLVGGLGEIGAALETNGSSWDTVWEGIKTVVQTAGDLISAVISTLCTVIATIVTEVQTDGTLLNAAWENITTIFSATITIIEDIITAFTAILQGDWDTALSAIEDAANTYWDAIRTCFDTVLTAIGNIVDSAMNAIRSTWESILNAISTTASSIWSTIQNTFSSFLSSISSTVSSVMSAISSTWSSILSAISSTASSIWSTIQSIFSSALSTISSTVSSVLSSVQGFFSNAMTTISGTVSGILQNIIGFFSNMGSSVVSSISGMAGNVVSTISGMASNMLAAVSGLPGQFYSIGSQIVSGVINGVWGAASSLYATLRNMASNALAAAKSALGIRSPSKAFADSVGQWIPKGIASGIEQNMAPVERAMEDLQDLTAGDWGVSVSGRIAGAVSAPVPRMDTAGRNGMESRDVIAAIQSVRADLQTMAGEIANMKIILDTGTLVGQMAGPMNTSLGQQYIYDRRGI